MATKTSICNMALRHLGHTKMLANVETDTTAVARACLEFYDQIIDEVLREFPWPFATRFDDLALVEENPTTEWGFAYRYPSGCLFFRRIPSGRRSDTRESAVPYIIGTDDTGQLIYTDEPLAAGEWTMRVTEAAKFPADFAQAVALLLAGLIAPSVTGGDTAKNGDRALRLYSQYAKPRAQSLAANEETRDQGSESQFIRVRNGFDTNDLGR